MFSKVAAGIRAEQRAAELALSPIERLELAQRLGDEALANYVSAHGLSPEAAFAELARRRQLGRRASASARAMSLLSAVAGRLESKSVACALIGAEALAIRGASRSTLVRDLLTTDRRVLALSFWDPPPAPGADLEVRAGDADDPLAGVVRFRAAGERPVDLIVGRHGWQDGILRRAEPMRIDSATIAVPRTADLILLKLFAGGPQDAWDIAQLLADPDRAAHAAEVESRLADLPEDAQELWRRLVAG
jgi:hypothetical protein